MANKIIYRVEETDKILTILEDKSFKMVEHIKSNIKHKYILYYKYLSHSDLLTSGKLIKKDGDLGKNLLYYLSALQMKEIENKENKKFETAHQSCISLSKKFWLDLDMKDPRDLVNGNEDTKKINNYANIYLVNDAMEFFDCSYTLKIFSLLKKEFNKNKWNEENMKFYLNDNDFTPINITQAVHGLGVKADSEFYKLRHNLFKNDIMFFLIEKRPITVIYILSHAKIHCFSIFSV